MFEKNSYHFIGIGGIGISAIARMLFLRGKKVSGSDSAQSEITDDLEKMSIQVAIGQKAENVPADTEAVIYTIAVTQGNPEMIEATKRNLPCFSYPQALGELSKEMYTIAISGTHGKTTTTAMIGHIMKKVGLDPTIIVGSKVIGENTNFLAGKSKYLVVEACEYKRSFLNLHPSILVITNIDADHLDYYKDMADIQSAFKEMAQKVPNNGYIVTNPKDKNVKTSLDQVAAKILDYSSVNLNIELLVPGKHNILDAQAAIKAVEAVGISTGQAENALKDFRGTWRRLEFKGEKYSNIFYTDYAHHPTEIKASILALKEKYPDREVVCVFEPHQELRTKLFFNDFVEVLKIPDRVLVAPIYVNKETSDGTITNKTLAEAVNKFVPSAAVENVEELKNYLKNIGATKPLCIILMGAGNIYKWTDEILNK